MISVIIPTYNEKIVLADCIESLGAQTFTDFEIIVVDDGSTDNTESVVRNIKSQITNLKFLSQKHRGAGAARNLGAKHAKGNILVFVDADMSFDKNFLKRLVNPIQKGKTKGTFSKDEYVENWHNVWAKCWNINEAWDAKKRHPKNYPDAQPVFRAILKSEFDRVGGFTPGGYDDDWSLYKKLNYKALNAPGAVFYHKNPSTLMEIYNHAKWVGKRNYKFGVVGVVAGLIRSSFPVSLIVGVYKTIICGLLPFILFKIVYDFGIFVGILQLIFTKKYSK